VFLEAGVECLEVRDEVSKVREGLCKSLRGPGIRIIIIWRRVTILIILSASVFTAQHFIRSADLLELVLVSTSVWVVCLGQFVIGVFDL